MKCKGDAEAPKEEPEKKEPVQAENSEAREKAIKDAKRVNICRGHYEGKFDEICKKYARCEKCWADFGRQE